MIVKEKSKVNRMLKLIDLQKLKNHKQIKTSERLLKLINKMRAIETDRFLSRKSNKIKQLYKGRDKRVYKS